MSNDTHYFSIKFTYNYEKPVVKNGKNTTETTETTVEITKTRQAPEDFYSKKGEKISAKAQLVYTTFNRKVYQPNEIVADVCFDKENSSTILGNLSVFFDSQVSLVCDDTDTYEGFYVYNVLPLQVPNTDLYIRFHIFSLDHQLTLQKYSRTYVAKRLGTDILAGISEDSGSVLDINKLSAEKAKDAKQLKFPVTVAKTNLDHLIYGSCEYIQPYLVQYNESFYDFMVRTANRCGEFFFWDQGVLRLGRSCTDGASLTTSNCTVYYKNTNTNVNYSTNYYALDDINRKEDLVSGISHCSDIKKKDAATFKKSDGTTETLTVDGDTFQYLSFGNDENKLNPDSSSSKYFYNNEVNQDVYRTRLYKDRFESLYDVTVDNAAKYMTSFVSLLLNETNLFDFLRKFTLTKVLSTTVAKAQLDHANSKGYDLNMDVTRGNADDLRKKIDGKDIVYANLFTSADPTGHLTNDGFYSGIRQKEELLSGQLITFVTTTPQKLWLGDSFTYNNTKYTIIQIKMKLGTNESKFTKIDAAVEEEFKDLESCMEVVAIPADGKTVYPPLHPAGHVRHSEPQVAFVSAFLDPQKRGRVRIKYPWQSAYDKEASPWIRVLTPSATPDGGCFFALAVGDEVLVNYESNNVERPYVAGTLYNKNNHAPFKRGDMALISKNGHGISFNDPIDFSKFIAGISPAYAAVNQFLAINTADWQNSLKLTGGTTISDAYGFYKIAMSTDQRRIDISSPLGKVNIDAFQGINILAPNGDINIKGQNINIEAGNSIKVTSGTNIAKKSYFGDLTGDAFIQNLVNSFEGAILDFVSPLVQLVDIDLLRKMIQVFLRPIDGTMEIKSHQYLLLEAGPGEALPKKDCYRAGKADDKYDKYRLPAKRQGEINTRDIALCSLIPMVSLYTDQAMDTVMTHYNALMTAREDFKTKRKKAIKSGAVEDNCVKSEDILQYIYNGGGALRNPVYSGAGGGADDKSGDLHEDTTDTADTHDTDFGDLGVAANAIVPLAQTFFNALKGIQVAINNATNPLAARANPANPTKEHWDKLNPAIRDVTLKTFIDDYFNGHYDITKKQVDELRKKIKRYWFSQCITEINNAGATVTVGTAYTANALGNKDNWRDYVKGLTIPGTTAPSLLEAVGSAAGSAALDATLRQWSDAFLDTFYDWNHWQPGRPGRILFSDSPGQTYKFDINSGQVSSYFNDWSHVNSFVKLKSMLNDL